MVNPSTKAWIILGVIALGLVTCFAIYDNVSRSNASALPKIVTLPEYKLAFIPETEEILFVDKKTNIVFQVLSKEVANSIFTIKAQNIQTEYDNASKDSKTKTSANKAVPKPTK